MKKRILIALVVVLALAATASLVWAGGGDTFGGYVRTLARAGIPDALEVLGLDFGALFVSPVTGTLPEIQHNEHPWTTLNNWVITEDCQYAVQWYTWTADAGWGEVGHDYISVWTKDEIGGTHDWYMNFDGTVFPLAGCGGSYYGYTFDVTY